MPNPGPNIFHKQHFSRSVCFSLGPVRVCCSPKLYIGIWLLVVRNGFFDKSQKDTTIKKFDFKEFIRTKTMRQRAKLRKRVQTILINKERFSKELHCLDYSELEVHSWVQIKLKNSNYNHLFQTLTDFKLDLSVKDYSSKIIMRLILNAVNMCYEIVKLLGANICSNFLTVLKYQVCGKGLDSRMYAINLVGHILRIDIIYINLIRYKPHNLYDIT